MAVPQMEPGGFAWLLGTTGRMPDAPTPAQFASACEFGLSAWQVLPAIGERLLSWGGHDLAAGEMAQRVRDRLVSLDVLGRLQLRTCARLLEAFQHRSIPYAMLKGSAARFTAYPDPKHRMGKDFDIAVPRQYLGRAEQAARAHGLVPAQWSPSKKRFHQADPLLRSIVEARHYELGFLVRRQVATDLTDQENLAIRRDLDSQFIWHLTDEDELACYISVDLHHGLSLEVNVEALVKEATPFNWNGLAVMLSPPEWTLFHLIYKIYWEGVHNYGKGAYQFADLVRMIPSTTAQTFARLVRMLRAHRLEAAAYFVLRRLKQNFGLSLQPEIDTFLDDAACPPSDLEPLQVNDLGDMWKKLWGAR